MLCSCQTNKRCEIGIISNLVTFTESERENENENHHFEEHQLKMDGNIYIKESE